MQPRSREATKRISLTAFVRVFVVAFLACAGLADAQHQSFIPAKDWESVERAESVGFSSERLAAVRAWVSTLDTTAMMVVVGGRTLFSYGDVTHLSYLASGRKSILSLLYGRYVEKGAIALDRTLADLKFTDVGGLLPREQGATIQQLLTARSGVYHPASNGGDDLAHAPPRGSQQPGTHFLYNNWDFNAAGAVFERLTGRDIYDALETDLAVPLGMQDFDRSRQVKSGNLEASQHRAYPIVLSTRDMARVGLLALHNGRWADRQIVPAEWMRRTTRLVSPLADMDAAFEDSPPTVGRWGYGYLWWVWDPLDASDPLAGAFTAWGIGGQYITVVPKLDMVVAHKSDPSTRAQPVARSGQARNGVAARQYDVILRMLVEAAERP